MVMTCKIWSPTGCKLVVGPVWVRYKWIGEEGSSSMSLLYEQNHHILLLNITITTQNYENMSIITSIWHRAKLYLMILHYGTKYKDKIYLDIMEKCTRTDRRMDWHTDRLYSQISQEGNNKLKDNYAFKRLVLKLCCPNVGWVK